jgi:RHS repeat-associated protein
MIQPGRKYTASSAYRYGFNGKEKADEIASDDYDFGARIYDGRIGRWLSTDPESKLYPDNTPYNYALNTPLSAIDPDGRLIIFIGGLRLFVGNGDQKDNNYDRKNSHKGIYDYDVFNYWSKDKNSFGRKSDIAGGFKQRIGDNNAWYTSGSSYWNSQPEKRIKQGKIKAEEFHAMVQSGQIKLEKDETIKIVAHSQGGAFSVGFAQQLMTYKDAAGKQLYNIEVMYYITPHQPDKFSHIPGVRGVQYSHPNDAISSNDPGWLPNGGSDFDNIEGITEFDGRDILGKPGQPPAEGPNGNRGGHNVTDNDFIFDIPFGSPGYIAPRKDSFATRIINKLKQEKEKKKKDD